MELFATFVAFDSFATSVVLLLFKIMVAFSGTRSWIKASKSSSSTFHPSFREDGGVPFNVLLRNQRRTLSL
ncbi:hypothetical protein ABEP00_18260 [Heyndrickxia sporothermodurans]|uniref:hypothetical protein n=1 Tax=Heyndrickxia sporothermodurans TaxID=46224 RepID=UPI003D1B1B57